MSHAFSVLFAQPQKLRILSNTCANPKATVPETGHIRPQAVHGFCVSEVLYDKEENRRNVQAMRR